MTSESRIRVLPDLLVNKIAAGEVVERPASVIKELVENAVDAGATRISVTVEDGGRQLMRITDDGCGMSAADLTLSVTPHATSKVVDEDDLYSIHTMGFRGEALASIAAVSKLRIVSRLHEDIEGHEVRMAGERFEASQSAGCPPGTTVEVRDLFFNVPARRKFLRTPTTEMGHINEQFARIALAFPDVAFELSNGRRVTQNLPACDNRLERITKFYGPELASALMHIERNERGVELDIYAAPPVQARATTQWQYVYVNGRYVRDRFIRHAVKEAYRGLMEPNRHGVVYLFVALDPRLVDVNVHPTKIEVRWADSNLIHSQVLSALRETFQRSDLTPVLRMDRAREPVDRAEQDRIRQEMAASFKSAAPFQRDDRPGSTDTPRAPSHGMTHPTQLTDPNSFGEARTGDRRSPLDVDPAQMWRSLYGTGDKGDVAVPESPLQVDAGRRMGSLDTEVSDAQPVDRGSPRAVQMHNLYLVAETDEGIIIVDQHALHERVMYEQLRARITAGPLESQRLLLPETVRVTPQQAALVESHAALLSRIGIEVTPFGTDAIAVHAFPALMKDTDVLSFMRDLLDRLAQHPVDGDTGSTPDDASSTEAIIHEVLDMMACKAAVKAGDPLTPDEIDALMRQRHLIEKSSSCPHGRPTMLRLTKADLNRQFKRT